MKTLQKGSAAVTAVLILIVVVIVALGAYWYYQRTHQAPVETTTSAPQQAAEAQPASNAAAPTTASPAPALPPHATPDPVTRVYADKTFGFSTVYPKAYTASTDKTGKVTTLAIANSGLTPITILRATNSADTSTGKWGKNVLSYGTNGWVTELQNEKDGSTYTAATVPFAFTDSGLPIFNGGTRHGFGLSVYVVALSHTKFLIISGGEGLTNANGYDYSTDPTLKVAKAVTAF